MTIYGDITPRTAAYVVKELLKRGMPYMVFEKFGQAKPIPKNSTKTISFRRYFLKQTFADGFTPAEYFTSTNFDPTNKVLTEGQTPVATDLGKLDLTATLTQYGDRTEVTDVIQDTHEDPVLQEAIEILGEQAAVILEKARYNILVGGSNVVYTAGTSRSGVNAKDTIKHLRLAERTLKRQLAKPVTSIVRSTPAYGTEPVPPAFVAVCHPDLEYDLGQISTFVPAEKYGSISPWENEIGKVGYIRFVTSTLVTPIVGAGASGGTNVIETSGNADVYPILIFAKDAYGLVPLKGKNAIIPMVLNPTVSDSDPLAQRGHASWKAMQTTVILNDAWMTRIECACTADNSLT